MKQAIVDNDERGTDMILPHAAQFLARREEQDQPRKSSRLRSGGGATFADVKDLVAGTRGGVVYDTGDTDYGILSAGQTQGLIHDIPSCKDLVERIVSEAESIIRSRLDKILA